MRRRRTRCGGSFEIDWEVKLKNIQVSSDAASCSAIEARKALSAGTAVQSRSDPEVARTSHPKCAALRYEPESALSRVNEDQQRLRRFEDLLDLFQASYSYSDPLMLKIV